MPPIIEISNLGKKYNLVHDKLPYRTMRDTLTDFAKHPFARRQQHETFWALKDINLNINRGDIVGIIGKNGAGKSTLLKILSGITKPTEGKVKLYGRVSSLLEVGTGFHPELTGRENIFLNGVILGMTRKEVAKKFDEIVSFAGIEKFLDTPVKHYSSGMYVRLAFAVAAHLEPDILIVDEVLAVGDAEFQKKCLGKMGEISKSEGRTVIFVSHNMDAISTLTKNCLYLKEGRKICYEKTLKTITSYLQHHIDTKHQFSRINDGSKAIITKVFIKTSEANNTHIQGKTLKIYIEFFSPKGIKGASLSFQVINENGIPYMHLWTYDDILPMGRKPGYYKVVCEIPKCHLYMGRFYLKTYLVDPSIKTPLDIVDEVCPFEVTMFGHVRDHPWHADTCTYIEDCIWSASHHE